MASQQAIKLKKRFEEDTADCFEALTFGELRVGDKFIPFPVPGDNHGHGGFKNGSYLFVKIFGLGIYNNAFNLSDSTMTEWAHHELVIKVL